LCAASPAPTTWPRRARYARWADLVVSRAFGKGGMSYSEEIARYTQAMLPDLSAAIPYLPADRRSWAAWRAAWVFRTFGRPAEAQQMLDLAEATARESNDQSLLGRAYQERAEQSVIIGNLDLALKYFNSAQAIFESADD